MRLRHHPILALALSILASWLAAPAVAAKTARAAEPVAVTVERVVDGDSLWVRTSPEAKPIELRLEGIDAPELCQPLGPESRDALAALLARGAVAMRAGARDSYGRTLATLTVDGQVVNERMVAEGMAWSTRTKWNRGPQIEKEKVAIALKRGVHAVPGSIPPWDFRRTKGPCPAPGAASAPVPGK